MKIIKLRKDEASYNKDIGILHVDVSIAPRPKEVLVEWDGHLYEKDPLTDYTENPFTGHDDGEGFWLFIHSNKCEMCSSFSLKQLEETKAYFSEYARKEIDKMIKEFGRLRAMEVSMKNIDYLVKRALKHFFTVSFERRGAGDIMTTSYIIVEKKVDFEFLFERFFQDPPDEMPEHLSQVFVHVDEFYDDLKKAIREIIRQFNLSTSGDSFVLRFEKPIELG